MIEIDTHTEELLRLLCKDLPEDSKTAAAIERNAPWTEISQYAEEEGLHQIAGTLAEAEEQRFIEAEQEHLEREGPPQDQDIVDVVRDHIQALRKNLPSDSKTAAAIDSNAPWMEISQCAEEEGLHQISSFLFEAEQQGLND